MSSWPGWTNYTPTGMTIQTGITMTAGDYYQAAPGVYLYYVGLTPDGSGSVYQVNAFSGGGGFGTTTVIQSFYKLQAAARDLGQDPNQP